AGEEAHRLQRRLAARAQQLRLAVGEEQALVLAQRLLDLLVARQRLGIEDAQPLGGLELGAVEVADAVLAHQAGRFLRHAPPVALLAVACMDAVMFASGHVDSSAACASRLAQAVECGNSLLPPGCPAAQGCAARDQARTCLIGGSESGHVPGSLTRATVGTVVVRGPVRIRRCCTGSAVPAAAGWPGCAGGPRPRP